jgi:hypothetical protein
VNFLLDYQDNLCYSYNLPVKAIKGLTPFDSSDNHIVPGNIDPSNNSTSAGNATVIIAPGQQNGTSNLESQFVATPTNISKKPGELDWNSQNSTHWNVSQSNSSIKSFEKSVVVPSRLTDDFVKQFQLNATQVEITRSAAEKMVPDINKKIGEGSRPPTLADFTGETKSEAEWDAKSRDPVGEDSHAMSSMYFKCFQPLLFVLLIHCMI